MADTLLDVVKRVRRKVGLDPTISSFGETDESNDNVQDVNDAYFELLRSLPKDTPYLVDVSGTLSTVANTRLYSLGATARTMNVLEWSFENETSGDVPLKIATLEFIQGTYPKYDEDTGQPSYIYREGDEQLGIYPIPDGVYSIKYKFSKTFTRLTSTTDEFIVPDEWVRYVEKKAQYLYEDRKGFGDPDATFAQSESIMTEILVEAEMMNPNYFLPENFF